MDLKTVIKKIFNKIGYEVHRTGKGGPYTICDPYGYTTYSPWFEDWFKQIYNKIKDKTLVTEDRCYIIHRFSQHCSHLSGHFAECGVYKGGTALLIASTVKETPAKRKLHLFDTFSGMPASANLDNSPDRKGDYGKTSEKSVIEYLQAFTFLVSHPGLIPDTFKSVEKEKFAFVHIDVDIFQSSIDCCRFFYGKMVKGGIMLFDDYGIAGYENGVKKAVDEFFHDKLENPISLRTGQCFITKL